MAPSGTSYIEHRRDPEGRVWWLLRGPFRRWDGSEVVQVTLGWEQGGFVRRDIHIDAAKWRAWEVV